MHKNPSTVIINELSRIRTVLERLESQESASKSAFNALYSELEDYKSDFFFKMEKSLLNDLLHFYDDLLWFQSTFKQDDNQVAESHRNNITHLLENYLELLSRRDVFPFPETNQFDSRLQRVLRIIPTADPTMDQQIAEVLRKGFFRGDKILRTEEICLYQYQEDT